MYFRHRYYDPKMGRFVSRDPLGVWGDPSQMGNAQSAFNCNPVNLRDPFGLDDRMETPGETAERLRTETPDERIQRELTEARIRGAYARLRWGDRDTQHVWRQFGWGGKQTVLLSFNDYVYIPGTPTFQWTEGSTKEEDGQYRINVSPRRMGEKTDEEIDLILLHEIAHAGNWGGQGALQSAMQHFRMYALFAALLQEALSREFYQRVNDILQPQPGQDAGVSRDIGIGIAIAKLKEEFKEKGLKKLHSKRSRKTRWSSSAIRHRMERALEQAWEDYEAWQKYLAGLGHQ